MPLRRNRNRSSGGSFLLVTFLWFVLANGCVPRQAPAGEGSPAIASSPDNRREAFDAGTALPASDVAGPDTDRDHIRDDVAAYIEHEYAGHEWKRLAARQYARALEHQLAFSASGDRDRAFEAADESGRAIECLYAHLDDAAADGVWKELHARSIDSEARLLAYAQLQKWLGGGYFKGAADPKQSCAFDASGLTP